MAGWSLATVGWCVVQPPLSLMARSKRAGVWGDATCRQTSSEPGRLAEDGHVARVSSELRDVGLHPLQREPLVPEPLVAHPRSLGGEPRVREEPEDAEPVVQRDDHCAVPRERCAAVEVAAVRERDRIGRRSTDVAASVEPHHDGELRGGGVRRPDVEVQAVLVRARRGLKRRIRHLRAAFSERGGVEDAGPLRRLLGRRPPKRAGWRLRVRDSEERGDLPVGVTLELPVADRDDRGSTFGRDARVRDRADVGGRRVAQGRGLRAVRTAGRASQRSAGAERRHAEEAPPPTRDVHLGPCLERRAASRDRCATEWPLLGGCAIPKSAHSSRRWPCEKISARGSVCPSDALPNAST